MEDALLYCFQTVIYYAQRYSKRGDDRTFDYQSLTAIVQTDLHIATSTEVVVLLIGSIIGSNVRAIGRTRISCCRVKALHG